MQLGKWQLDTLNGGEFWLDGGVMYGVVPKSLWGNVVAADANNRIPCANNCVLARDGQNTVLIDTGYGGKFGLLDRKFYGMEAGEPLVADLAALGVQPADIDTVVFSHLHFDHVCGATRFDSTGARVPIFENARHVVGRSEWEDACSGMPELQTAYPASDILPLEEAGLVTLIDDGAELLPGLRAQLTGGHTRGHMSLFFESDNQTAVYPGDICPTTTHLRRMWHLAYDTFPIETRRRKPELLGKAADEGWWILWNHDPRVGVSRVSRDRKKEFVTVEGRSRL